LLQNLNIQAARRGIWKLDGDRERKKERKNKVIQRRQPCGSRSFFLRVKRLKKLWICKDGGKKGHAKKKEKTEGIPPLVVVLSKQLDQVQKRTPKKKKIGQHQCHK
jgi:hypothetical protein